MFDYILFIAPVQQLNKSIHCAAVISPSQHLTVLPSFPFFYFRSQFFSDYNFSFTFIFTEKS